MAMSAGSACIPLLKAAPEPAQLHERLDGGDWRGLELCLAPRHVADDAALAAAVDAVRTATAGGGLVVAAEAPVAWPSGAFVRVDRLSEEARDGIDRSARFAAAIGAEVLTIHLFVPQTPAEFRATAALDERAIAAFLSYYADACERHGVHPLIENVPPVLRMRTGGFFLSSVGGHWRDLAAWRAREERLGFTLDTSHAALFANFVGAYPALFAADDDAELDRFVEELGPATVVAHVSNAAGLLGEGLPYEEGELSLDPVVARLGAFARYMVAEINEPDPGSSPSMKAAHRAISAALAAEPPPYRRPVPRLRERHLDWQRVLERRDPVPSVLALEERCAGRRIMITGGGGSIGRALTTLLTGLRPELVTVLDSHEAALTADRRERGSATLRRVEHVLCDIRDRHRLAAEVARASPDVIFHLAAYKHVDWAERFPEEFAATNLDGSWNVLRAADAVGCRTVVVASTDKAARAASTYGRSKRLMEELAALAAARGGGERAAVRLVNVLGSAGSASELFVRQARAGVPLTVTDTGMTRYWITMPHAVALMVHGMLLAGEGERLATAAEPCTMAVGDLAERIWRAAGPEGPPAVDVIGVRAGETMDEVLVGAGETLGQERHQGSAPILAEPRSSALGPVIDEVELARDMVRRRALWLAVLRSQPALPG